MDRTTFIDKIKLLFSEVEQESEKVEHSDCECKGEKDCECDKYAEEEVKEEEPKEDEMEKRLEALEKALANISESMSAIDSLSLAVSELANSPSEGEVKLSKASGKSVKKELTSRESKLKAFAKR